jgi:hypothetical protein
MEEQERRLRERMRNKREAGERGGIERRLRETMMKMREWIVVRMP